MNRYAATLFIAAIVYLVAPPAHAHGLPPGLANFILALLVLTPIVPTLTDLFAIKRWLFADGAWLAAILANLAAFAIGIPLFLALQWLSGEAAAVLEMGSVSAAYWLRVFWPWPEGLITIVAMTVTKAAVLRWRFGDRLSRPTIGLLFFSTLAGMSGAVAAAAVFAHVSTA